MKKKLQKKCLVNFDGYRKIDEEEKKTFIIEKTT